eukprot:Skav209497  [mRNA]  locus=scaffold1892:330281:335623:+ [translate_table: standard]
MQALNSGIEVEELLETLLAPRTGRLMVAPGQTVTLVGPVGSRGWMPCGIEGFSEALPQVASSLYRAPQRFELWALVPVLAALILAVRSAAASPLRKALEVHDTLSVLAAYGVLSSVAAVATGTLIYSELVAWKPERQGSPPRIADGHGSETDCSKMSETVVPVGIAEPQFDADFEEQHQEPFK